MLAAVFGMASSSPAWADYRAVEWNYNNPADFYCTGANLATRDTCPQYRALISSPRVSAATNTNINVSAGGITDFGRASDFVNDDPLLSPLDTALGLGGLNTTSLSAARTAGDYVEYSFTTASSLPAGTTLSTFAFGNFTNLLTGTRFGGDLDFAVEISANGFATAGALLVGSRDYALLAGDTTINQTDLPLNNARYRLIGAPTTNPILSPSTTYTLRVYLFNSDVGYNDGAGWNTLNFIDDPTLFFDEETLITLTKAMGGNRVSGTDQFTVQIRNGATVLTTPGNDTSAGTGSTVNANTGTTGATIVTPSTTYTLTEVAAGSTNLANYTQSIACTNTDTGSATVLPSGTTQPFTVTSTSAADNITCTLTNTPRTTVTVTKVSNGGTGTFAFSGTNGIANHNIVTATSGVGVAGATQTLTAAGTATTITEAAPPAGFALASITCTGLGAGGTATPTINGTSGGNVVLNAAATAAGSNIACTFTNTRLPTVTVTKISNGGTGTFAFSGTNGVAAHNIVTATSGVGVAGAMQTLTTAGAATTITEATPPAGFSLSSITCTGLGAGGTATPTINGTSGGSVLLNAAATAAGSNIACTFTNTRLPTVTVTKVSNGGTGTFAFSGTNGVASHNIVTATSGVGVAGAIQTLTAAGTATTITESAPPAGFALTAISCSGLGAGGTATPTINGAAGGNVVLNAAATAAGSNIACTFTNARQPILRLQKQLPNGRFVTSDQFTLSIGGSAVTTTGSGSTSTGTVTVNPATIATSYTFTEVAAAGANLANYAVTYTCANALSGGQAPSGSGTSFSLTPVAGDDLTCTFVNTRNPLADLSITKSNTTNTVTRGTTTTYTIVVTNNGPDAVTGAVVRDPAQAGLTCNTPVSCTGSGCPSPTVPLSTLQSTGGVILGTVANGGTVTFTLSCAVQ